jgi:alkylhydroperoxidase family enzyme
MIAASSLVDAPSARIDLTSRSSDTVGSPASIFATRDWLDFIVFASCDRAARDATLFNQAEQTVLDLTMAMTRHVHVSAELMAATRAALRSDQELVELVGVIATYNMVSRFLVALGIEPEEEPSWMR